MFTKTIKVRNGNNLVSIPVYKCDQCEDEILDSYPRYEEKHNNYHLCVECAFRERRVNEKWFLRFRGFDIHGAHAAINPDGDIEVWIGGKTPPWERNNQKQRSNPRYKAWRKKVFERDNYTCRKCNQRGVILNAHHIKPFSEYKKLRFDVDNGLTLCEKCHKDLHKNEKVI